MLNSQNGALANKSSLTSRNVSYLANDGNSNRENGANSNKFLEDLLANNISNNRRSIKTGVSPNHLNPYNNTVFSNSSIGAQQMPTSFTVFKRTNEERGLYPDKLILEM